MSIEELRYCRTHEWLAIEGNRARLGITDYAQHELGDIVYVELPEAGATLSSDAPFGVVESVKAVSDLVCPVTATVLEVNESLLDKPETANQDCYGEGWMLEIELTKPSEIEGLMTYDQYKTFLDEGAA